MWYLIYVGAAIAAATYFWSWGSERRLGWLIMTTAMAIACAGASEFSLLAAIGGAHCTGLACMAIGLLGRTIYDQIHNPQPAMAM